MALFLLGVSSREFIESNIPPSLARLKKKKKKAPQTLYVPHHIIHSSFIAHHSRNTCCNFSPSSWTWATGKSPVRGRSRERDCPFSAGNTLPIHFGAAFKYWLRAWHLHPVISRCIKIPFFSRSWLMSTRESSLQWSQQSWSRYMLCACCTATGDRILLCSQRHPTFLGWHWGQMGSLSHSPFRAPRKMQQGNKTFPGHVALAISSLAPFLLPCICYWLSRCKDAGVGVLSLPPWYCWAHPDVKTHSGGRLQRPDVSSWPELLPEQTTGKGMIFPSCKPWPWGAGGLWGGRLWNWRLGYLHQLATFTPCEPEEIAVTVGEASQGRTGLLLNESMVKQQVLTSNSCREKRFFP